MLSACQSSTVQLIPGPKGDDGQNGHSLISQTQSASAEECVNGGNHFAVYLDVDDSFTVSEGDVEEGFLIACNGAPGSEGPVGEGAVLQSYNLGSSCLSIGSGLYAKKDGSSSAKIYDDSECHVQEAVLSSQESYWLTSSRLAFADADTTSGVVLRVLNFN